MPLQACGHAEKKSNRKETNQLYQVSNNVINTKKTATVKLQISPEPLTANSGQKRDQLIVQGF
jgi:hypothetical protein